MDSFLEQPLSALQAWGLSYICFLPTAFLFKKAPAVAIITSALGLITPFLTDNMAMRAYLCFSSIWFFIRNCEMVSSPQVASSMSLSHRLCHTFFYADVMRAKRVDHPVMIWRLHGRTLLHIAAGYFLFTTLAETQNEYLKVLLGWAFLADVMYFLDSSVRSTLALVGVLAPPLVDYYWYRSKTIGDFWRGENLVVQPVLRRIFFEPARSLGVPPTIALLLTFAGSALYHAYPSFAALGKENAISTLRFFMYHAILMMVENGILKVQKWDPTVARLWTWGAIFVTLPTLLHAVNLI